MGQFIISNIETKNDPEKIELTIVPELSEAPQTTEDLLKRLAEIRMYIQETSEGIKKLQASLDEEPKYKVLQISKNVLKTYQAEADLLTAEIKTAALAEYKKTLQKPTILGLAVRINKILKYNLESVTAWAKDNAKVLFKFDVGEFEKMAQKIDVPGVERKDDPTITIASDLSEYLK